MKKIFAGIFIGLGVIFLALIALFTYLFITDPYDLKPLVFGDPIDMPVAKTDATTTENPTTEITTTTETPTGGFQLSDNQKKALVDLGLDPAMVPTYVSAAQEACFVSVLGEARVGEIRAGAVPNPLEFLRAKACI